MSTSETQIGRESRCKICRHKNTFGLLPLSISSRGSASSRVLRAAHEYAFRVPRQLLSRAWGCLRACGGVSGGSWGALAGFLNNFWLIRAGSACARSDTPVQENMKETVGGAWCAELRPCPCGAPELRNKRRDLETPYVLKAQWRIQNRSCVLLRAHMCSDLKGPQSMQLRLADSFHFVMQICAVVMAMRCK